MLRRLLTKLPFPYGQLIKAQTAKDSYLIASGWARSRRDRAPVDRDGKPLPWYTYPAIRFLEARMRPDFRVIEFGAGNSTLWWAEQAASVRAIEHDAGWVRKLKPRLPDNATVEHRAVESSFYPVADGGPWHVAVIDGRRRIECARSAAGALTDDGVLLWDNSERERYVGGRAELTERGFRHIDFRGVVPGGVKEIATTIFYRDGNCLGI